MLPLNPGNSGSTTSSGRKVVITLPSQSRAILAWCTSGSSALSVVASSSILKRLNSGPGAEFRALQSRTDTIEIIVGRGGAKPLVDVEHAAEHLIHPLPRRCAREQIIVSGEQPPDFPAILLHPAAGAVLDAQAAECYALTIQHPQQVVIRPQESGYRVLERRVIGKPSRIGMTMRADDRKVFNRRKQAAGDRPYRGLGRQKSIGMTSHRTLWT